MSCLVNWRTVSTRIPIHPFLGMLILVRLKRALLVYVCAELVVIFTIHVMAMTLVRRLGLYRVLFPIGILNHAIQSLAQLVAVSVAVCLSVALHCSAPRHRHMSRHTRL